MPLPRFKYPSKLDPQVLRAPWQGAPLTVSDVCDALANRGRTLAHASVITARGKMVDKSPLHKPRHAEGKSFRFKLAITSPPASAIPPSQLRRPIERLLHLPMLPPSASLRWSTITIVVALTLSMGSESLLAQVRPERPANNAAPGENNADEAQSDRDDAAREPRKGLEFLAPYPRLRSLSLEMTHADFLEIVKREELETESTNKSSYSIATGDGHVVIVMFGNNGNKCSGIQRLHGGLRQLPDRRFEGEEVSVENIQRLAGRSWNTVTMAGGSFDGVIIARLKQATSIRSLRLFGEGLSGQIPRLRHINGLVSLELGGPLVLRDLEALGELNQIQHLKLPQEMGLTVTGAKQIARMTNLESLGLYNVEVDDASIAQLASLVNLQRLDLSHTRVTDKGLKAIEKMPRLRELMLTRYDVPQQISDACVPSILKLPHLETLWLSGDISDDGLAQLAKAPKLTSLSILFTAITGEGLAALADSSVEQLTLSTSQMRHPSTIRNLKKCRRLKSVHVNGEPSGEEDDWQRQLPNLGWGFQS